MFIFCHSKSYLARSLYWRIVFAWWLLAVLWRWEMEVARTALLSSPECQTDILGSPASLPAVTAGCGTVWPPLSPHHTQFHLPSPQTTSRQLTPLHNTAILRHQTGNTAENAGIGRPRFLRWNFLNILLSTNQGSGQWKSRKNPTIIERKFISA